MHWVVQNGFNNDPSVVALRENLDKLGVSWSGVDVIPFSEELHPPLPPEVDEKNIVVYGSITLSKIAKLKNWQPGSFTTAEFNMKSVLEHWKHKCLSYEGHRFGTIEGFNELNLPNEFFIRPNEDNKAFSGQVMTIDEFLLWRSNVIQWMDANSQVNTKTAVMIAPVQQIQAEFRFFVVDGRIITGSMYNLCGDLVKKPYEEIDDFVKQYAMACVNLQCSADRIVWNPSRAFALDIAINADGEPKILEIGCLNSCGFYAADTQKLIMAIEDMK